MVVPLSCVAVIWCRILWRSTFRFFVWIEFHTKVDELTAVAGTCWYEDNERRNGFLWLSDVLGTYIRMVMVTRRHSSFTGSQRCIAEFLTSISCYTFQLVGVSAVKYSYHQLFTPKHGQSDVRNLLTNCLMLSKRITSKMKYSINQSWETYGRLRCCFFDRIALMSLLYRSDIITANIFFVLVLGNNPSFAMVRKYNGPAGGTSSSCCWRLNSVIFLGSQLQFSIRW